MILLRPVRGVVQLIRRTFVGRLVVHLALVQIVLWVLGAVWEMVSLEMYYLSGSEIISTIEYCSHLDQFLFYHY